MKAWFKIVGRFQEPKTDTFTFLYQDGELVYRQDTGKPICHISRLQSLAEISTRIEVKNETTR